MEEIVDKPTDFQELRDILESTRLTTKESIIVLLIILTTLLFHLIFTLILHLG